jgi:hypothetical protein
VIQFIYKKTAFYLKNCPSKFEQIKNAPQKLGKGMENTSNVFTR